MTEYPGEDFLFVNEKVEWTIVIILISSVVAVSCADTYKNMCMYIYFYIIINCIAEDAIHIIHIEQRHE